MSLRAGYSHSLVCGLTCSFMSIEMTSPTVSSIPQSIEPASSAEGISISTTVAPSARITSHSRDSVANSLSPFSRSSKSTSNAVPRATDISAIPPLGRSAPRDCPTSNGTRFTITSPLDQSELGSGTTIVYEKICGTNMEATNKTDLASFVVNSFDLCIQTCAGAVGVSNHLLKKVKDAILLSPRIFRLSERRFEWEKSSRRRECK